ncbi:MAG: ATP-binding cassette domain-containing protein [Proteobacteria bacterium]|nr:ATP-binding cassette domain-containing protein [Pseudomonadota bacterium]
MSLELRHITKQFPGVLANDDVNLSVAAGETVALLGENGAGKTTLMNIVYGLYRPTSGEVLVDGKVLDLQSPGDAIAAGIGMVHQHFMLVPVFSVAENVILGDEPTKSAGWLDFQRARKSVRDISSRYKLDVDPDAMVEDLPVGIQQRVEIIKVLAREAEFLVFDEPTSVLTPPEVEGFFEIVNGLKADGKGIIFISHKLGEALEIADRIVIMRRGKTVAEVLPSEVDEEKLAELMVGRPVDLVVDRGKADPKEVVLSVESLTVLDDRNHAAVRDVSFSIRAGEIVGIAGVQGNGQTELVESLTGLRPSLGGAVILEGKDVTTKSPRAIHNNDVAHVPEDRHKSGLVLPFTITENIVLDSYHQPPISRGVFMDWNAARDQAERLVEQYDVRTPGIEVLVANLSGGNQQKVIVAREFDRNVKLVIASQPTRGVDVGSIEYIHARIVEERDAGAAVLIVSSELDEIMALSDRILVMYDGGIAGEFDGDASVTDIGLAMLGSQGEAEAS